MRIRVAMRHLGVHKRCSSIWRLPKEPYKSAIDRISNIARNTAMANAVAIEFGCGKHNRKAGRYVADDKLHRMSIWIGTGCQARRAVEGCDSGGILPRSERQHD